ncbi:MAG: amino acid ABC transporter ATP-binding protein [Flavobacteriaceae bacterium]|nr:amino acid ABC transporter ATP-binding protein [Flavobacteriaceae bacterium]
MIEVNSLNKNINGEPILKDISFKIIPGKITAIIGPSGSGKTTLLNCISLLSEIESGDVIIDGETYLNKNKSLKSIYPKIGIVFQEPVLWPHMTNHENIELPLKENNLSLNYQSLANKLNVYHLMKKYPHQCSGGERQRIYLLRQLLLQPQYLFLDEITSALDVEHIQQVIDILFEYKKNNVGILLITHSINFATKLADDFIFLDKGEVIEQGIITQLNDPLTKRLKIFLEFNL